MIALLALLLGAASAASSCQYTIHNETYDLSTLRNGFVVCVVCARCAVL